MIKTAEEFNRLRLSENLEDQRRASVEEASITTWREVIDSYPELKEWVIYNKTIPIEILNQLSNDPKAEIRSEVARKRKINSEIFDRLKNDQDENVKLSLFYNPKLTEDQKNQINTSGSIWYQRQVFRKTKVATDSIREIELFGYTQYWIELGIVDKAKIQEDIRKFKSGEDSDPDHFRHQRLIQWLKDKTETNQLEIDTLCNLVKNDIDISYANNLATEFYDSNFIDERLRSLIEDKFRELNPFLTSFVRKRVIEKKIANNELSKMELSRLIEEEQNTLLRLLVDKTEDFGILELLSEYDGSKKIRNVAIQKLKKAGNNGL